MCQSAQSLKHQLQVTHVGGGGLLSRLLMELSLMGIGLRLRLRLASVAPPATLTLGMNWTEALRAGLLSSELWKRMGKGRGLSAVL